MPSESSSRTPSICARAWKACRRWLGLKKESVRRGRSPYYALNEGPKKKKDDSALVEKVMKQKNCGYRIFQQPLPANKLTATGMIGFRSLKVLFTAWLMAASIVRLFSGDKPTRLNALGEILFIAIVTSFSILNDIVAVCVQGKRKDRLKKGAKYLTEVAHLNLPNLKKRFKDMQRKSSFEQEAFLEKEKKRVDENSHKKARWALLYKNIVRGYFKEEIYSEYQELLKLSKTMKNNFSPNNLLNWLTLLGLGLMNMALFTIDADRSGKRHSLIYLWSLNILMLVKALLTIRTLAKVMRNLAIKVERELKSAELRSLLKRRIKQVEAFDVIKQLRAADLAVTTLYGNGSAKRNIYLLFLEEDFSSHGISKELIYQLEEYRDEFRIALLFLAHAADCAYGVKPKGSKDFILCEPEARLAVSIFENKTQPRVEHKRERKPSRPNCCKIAWEIVFSGRSLNCRNRSRQRPVNASDNYRYLQPDYEGLVYFPYQSDFLDAVTNETTEVTRWKIFFKFMKATGKAFTDIIPKSPYIILPRQFISAFTHGLAVASAVYATEELTGIKPLEKSTILKSKIIFYSMIGFFLADAIVFIKNFPSYQKFLQQEKTIQQRLSSNAAEVFDRISMHLRGIGPATFELKELVETEFKLEDNQESKESLAHLWETELHGFGESPGQLFKQNFLLLQRLWQSDYLSQICNNLYCLAVVACELVLYIKKAKDEGVFAGLTTDLKFSNFFLVSVFSLFLLLNSVAVYFEQKTLLRGLWSFSRDQFYSNYNPSGIARIEDANQLVAESKHLQRMRLLVKLARTLAISNDEQLNDLKKSMRSNAQASALYKELAQGTGIFPGQWFLSFAVNPKTVTTHMDGEANRLLEKAAKHYRVYLAMLYVAARSNNWAGLDNEIQLLEGFFEEKSDKVNGDEIVEFYTSNEFLEKIRAKERFASALEILQQLDRHWQKATDPTVDSRMLPNDEVLQTKEQARLASALVAADKLKNEINGACNKENLQSLLADLKEKFLKAGASIKESARNAVNHDATAGAGAGAGAHLTEPERRLNAAESELDSMQLELNEFSEAISADNKSALETCLASCVSELKGIEQLLSAPNATVAAEAREERFQSFSSSSELEALSDDDSRSSSHQFIWQEARQEDNHARSESCSDLLGPLQGRGAGMPAGYS